MSKGQIRNSFLLLITATIWGISFVAQSVGMDHVGPFTFNGLRLLMGGIVLLPFVAFNSHRAKKRGEKIDKKILLVGGIACGLALCLASTIQQFGVMYTTVGKAGFITSFYIVLVPILGLFLRKRTGPWIWAAVALALVGLYLLCINGEFDINKGDLLILICSFCFSIHILVIDYFSPKADGITLSCIQFFTSGIICTICMFIFETPNWADIMAAAVPLVYAGVFSCGIAYTLQVVGQKGMNPTVASLILSLESCISVLAGWLLLNQRLTSRELIGCVIMFAAIILAQLPDKRKPKEA